jgi:putative peptidoglycan lipid II flippase
MSGRAARAVSASGPFAVAGATFLVTLLLLNALPAAEFGVFAFLLVVTNLGSSLSNALVGAPMAVLVSGPDRSGQDAVLTVGTGLSLLVGLAAAGCALLLGAADAAVPAGIFGVASTLRWNRRGVAFAELQPHLALRSDLTYALGLIAPVLLLLFIDDALGLVMWGFALAALIGWAVILPVSATRTALTLSGYGAVWREKSRWTLLGVVTTDATANAHAYLVTGIAGPAAFALIAAAMLPFRPVGVMSAALVQYERPRLARAIAAGNLELARAKAGGLRLALLSTWFAGSLLALLFLLPQTGLSGLISPPEYDPVGLALASLLWCSVWLLRALREAPSALLQGAGAFRPLALASCASALVSVLGVLGLLLLSGPLASMFGLIAGELVFLLGTLRLASRLQKEVEHG